MRRRRTTAVALVAVAAMTVSACGSKTETGSDAAKTLTIGVDLPFQGSSKDLSTSIFNAMKLYLDQVGGKAGKYDVVLKEYDNSTAAKGSWDETTCKKNAAEHVANADEVATLAPYNSPCSIAEVPILNQDASGPMPIIACCNTYPGLTKAWNPDEPMKYYPSGKRNYARVGQTDDLLGAGQAQFAAKELGVKRCAVLNDSQAYGKGVAKAFADEAREQGIEVVFEKGWDAKQITYTALFTEAKAASPDCVYLGGLFDQNGAQVIKDKVAVLGGNDAVKLIAPSGFSGYPAMLALAEAQGTYLAFPGINIAQLEAGGGNGAKFLEAYKAAYGAPATNYFVYGVLALQVMLAAIEASDGTRKGVWAAIFEGSGVTVPASTSVLGKELRIDPQTGDNDLKALTMLQVKDGTEVSLKAWTTT